MMAPPRDHSCVEHARFKQADWVETHGLDCGPFERGTDEWWECSVCHDRFTKSELDKLAEDEGCPCCAECPECTCHLSEEERVIAESERESDEATRRANAAFEARYCGGEGYSADDREE